MWKWSRQHTCALLCTWVESCTVWHIQHCFWCHPAVQLTGKSPLWLQQIIGEASCVLRLRRSLNLLPVELADVKHAGNPSFIRWLRCSIVSKLSSSASPQSTHLWERVFFNSPRRICEAGSVLMPLQQTFTWEHVWGEAHSSPSVAFCVFRGERQLVGQVVKRCATVRGGDGIRDFQMMKAVTLVASTTPVCGCSSETVFRPRTTGLIDVSWQGGVWENWTCRRHWQTHWFSQSRRNPPFFALSD